MKHFINDHEKDSASAGYFTDYLFHFMGRHEPSEKCPDIMFNILRDGLRFNWNEKESLAYLQTLPEEFQIKISVPVICFTEIPLEYIHHHAEKYGYFGIGLSKNWAIKNHVQPVIYLDRDDLGFGNGLRLLLESIKDDSRVEEALSYIVPFFRELQFHEEREWRFTTQFTKHETVEEEKDGTIKSAHYMRFKRDDIKNIVVPERFVEEVEQGIVKMYLEKYGDTTIPYPIVPFESIAVH